MYLDALGIFFAFYQFLSHASDVSRRVNAESAIISDDTTPVSREKWVFVLEISFAFLI